jgi:hypothetical protein
LLLKNALARARTFKERARTDRTRAYFLNGASSGLVGWIFFDFFKVFLAMLFSLSQFAQMGSAVVICKAVAKVHTHFCARRSPVFVGFSANPLQLRSAFSRATR